MIQKGERWYISARDKVIEDAKKTVADMPEHQRESLKREFDRAEAEAERIRTHQGSRQ